MPQLAEQINEARRNGYSDDEITGFLKQKPDLAPKVQEAFSSGYSASEILQHLAPPAPALPGFGQRVYEQTLQGPVELAKGMWNDPKGTLMKTLASLTATQIQGVQNPMRIQAASPVTPIIEDVRSGNLSGAAGGVTGLGLTLLTPVIAAKTPKVIRATPTAVRGAVEGGLEAARSGKTVAESGLVWTAGQVGGPKAAAAVATATTGTRVAAGAARGARAALKARAAAAAEALAAENVAAKAAAGTPPEPPPAPGPPGTRPQARAPFVPPEPPPVTPPPTAARPTPPPEPAPAAPTPPTATMSPAERLRQEMGLQPGQFEPPATFEPPGVATAARKAQIDRMARHMRESGITAAQADLLDPPALTDLAKLAGAEGPLGKVAKEVKLRMQEFETEASETAKYQAAWDKLSKSERRAFFDDENPPPPAAPPAEPVVTTPAEANVELGKLYPAPEPVETTAALTAPQKRVQALAEWLAEEPIGTDLVEKLETDARARLLLGEQSRRLGHRSIGPGEIPQIIEEVKRLRSAKPTAATFDPEWFSKSKAIDESGAPVRVYHGTQATFDQFSPEAILEGSEQGFFFTDSPSMAGKYAETYKHAPGKTPPRPFQTPPGANVRPSYLKMEKPLIKEFHGKPKYESYEQMISRAKAAGHDGLILRNIDDPVPGDSYDPFGGVPHDVYVVFSPDQVRPAFGKALTATERAVFEASKKAKRK